MIDLIVSTKEESEGSDRSNKGAGKTSNISPSYQTQAGLLGHDGDIKQRSAHGHVAVTGHDRQEVAVNGRKEGEEEELGSTARFGDDSATFQQHCQHLGDDGGGLADVHEGKVAEEEVWGCGDGDLCGSGRWFPSSPAE